MIVCCISNTGTSLPVELIWPVGGYTKEREFPLILGKKYTVYGITIFQGHPWYYVCDEDYSYYPVWRPWVLFEVSDARLSKYWIVGHQPIDDNLYSFIIAFPEWVNDPEYYDQLTDGDEPAVSIFKKYKQSMDSE